MKAWYLSLSVKEPGCRKTRKGFEHERYEEVGFE
jgi:hypothetical protein